MAYSCGILHCAICRGGRGASWGVLACGHAFHLARVQEWLCRKASCPTCRADAHSAHPLVGVETQVARSSNDGYVGEVWQPGGA
jgi:hypothetical protein